MISIVALQPGSFADSLEQNTKLIGATSVVVESVEFEGSLELLHLGAKTEGGKSVEEPGLLTDKLRRLADPVLTLAHSPDDLFLIMTDCRGLEVCEGHPASDVFGVYRLLSVCLSAKYLK